MHQSGGKCTPVWMRGVLLHHAQQIVAVAELVRLRTRVGDEPGQPSAQDNSRAAGTTVGTRLHTPFDTNLPQSSSSPHRSSSTPCLRAFATPPVQQPHKGGGGVSMHTQPPTPHDAVVMQHARTVDRGSGFVREAGADCTDSTVATPASTAISYSTTADSWSYKRFRIQVKGTAAHRHNTSRCYSPGTAQGTLTPRPCRTSVLGAPSSSRRRGCTGHRRRSRRHVLHVNRPKRLGYEVADFPVAAPRHATHAHTLARERDKHHVQAAPVHHKTQRGKLARAKADRRLAQRRRQHGDAVFERQRLQDRSGSFDHHRSNSIVAARIAHLKPRERGAQTEVDLAACIHGVRHAFIYDIKGPRCTTHAHHHSGDGKLRV
jgi:hypothetical protein